MFAQSNEVAEFWLLNHLNFGPGRVYSIVSPDSEYTPVAFNFNAPFGIIFDEYAYERGAPRLFVCDFHRLIQIDLDPESFPIIVRH